MWSRVVHLLRRCSRQVSPKRRYFYTKVHRILSQERVIILKQFHYLLHGCFVSKATAWRRCNLLNKYCNFGQTCYFHSRGTVKNKRETRGTISSENTFSICLPKYATLCSRDQKYSRKQWSNGRKFQLLYVATCPVYNRPTSASMRDFNAPALKRNYNTIYCNVFISFILAIILHSIFSHMLPVQVFVNNFSTVI